MTPSEDPAITEPTSPEVAPEADESEIEADILALAKDLAGACIESKAADVTILDLRGLVDFADFFVLCTARNPRQVRAVAESVRQCAKHDHDTHAVGVEGMTSGKWVLADFGDVVVHVFDRDMRAFYDLDGLWRDAPHVDPPEVEVEELPEPFFTLT